MLNVHMWQYADGRFTRRRPRRPQSPPPPSPSTPSRGAVACGPRGTVACGPRGAVACGQVACGPHGAPHHRHFLLLSGRHTIIDRTHPRPFRGAKNKTKVSSTEEMVQGEQNQNIWSRGQGNGATQAGFHRAFSYGYLKPSFATKLNYWRPSERSLMDSRGAPSSVL